MKLPVTYFQRTMGPIARAHPQIACDDATLLIRLSVAAGVWKETKSARRLAEINSLLDEMNRRKNFNPLEK